MVEVIEVEIGSRSEALGSELARVFGPEAVLRVEISSSARVKNLGLECDVIKEVVLDRGQMATD